MSTVAASTRILHVANGHSTTMTIEKAMIPGTLAIWADPLHEGPVPGGIPDDELVRIRATYLASDQHEIDETATELRGWRATLDGCATYSEVVLWYEHDLFDQLNLLQVLDRLATTPRGNAAISLVSIGSFPGRPAFKGMGELTADELAPLFDTRQPVEGPQYAIAQTAWGAFRAEDPRQLQALLATDLSPLPFLTAALARHLEEFPSAANGLSRSEQHLLELVSSGTSDVWALFPRMHEGEDCFYVADVSFWNMIDDLASTSPRLLEVDITSNAPGMLARGSVTLTDSGRDVLAGTADRIRLCGIDRWLGGTHVTAASPWRWDAGTRRITAP